jgi:hypothetical protein
VKKIGICYFILVILCSILPCSDSLEARFNSQDTIQNFSHYKQDDSTENCTSICLCTCCGQRIVVQTPMGYEIKITTLIAKKLDFIQKFKLLKRAQNIWQPPKILV